MKNKLRSVEDVLAVAKARGFDIVVKPGDPPMPALRPLPGADRRLASEALIEALRVWRVEILEIIPVETIPEAPPVAPEPAPSHEPPATTPTPPAPEISAPAPLQSEPEQYLPRTWLFPRGSLYTEIPADVDLWQREDRHMPYALWYQREGDWWFSPAEPGAWTAVPDRDIPEGALEAALAEAYPRPKKQEQAA